MQKITLEVELTEGTVNKLDRFLDRNSVDLHDVIESAVKSYLSIQDAVLSFENALQLASKQIKQVGGSGDQ